MAISEGSRSRTLQRRCSEWATRLIEEHHPDPYSKLMELLSEFNEQHCMPPKDKSFIIDTVYKSLRNAGRKSGNEQTLSSQTLERLSEWFHVDEQVNGMHWSGKKVRIDAILTPKDTSEWKSASPHLGIEFKNFNKFNPSFDIRDYTRWWAQSHDYAESCFDGYGHVYVFTYQCMTRFRQHFSHEAVLIAQRLLGQVGVGELCLGRGGFPSRQSLQFSLQGHTVWCEVEGIKCGKQWSMERKFGSR